MSKDFILFEKDELSFSNKFLRLMDLLVTNKSSSRLECIILFGIFYVQILSGFFAEQVGVMDLKYSDSDIILNYLQRIIRVKDLFRDNYSGFQIALILLLIALICLTAFVVYLTYKISKHAFYTYQEVFLNFFFKSFIYVLFIPILDLCLANLCFETYYSTFPSLTCVDGGSAITLVIGIILILYAIFCSFFIQVFYADCHFLSNSYYSRMSYPYETYITLNNIIFAILLSQARYIGQEVFLIYNLIVSFIFLKI